MGRIGNWFRGVFNKVRNFGRKAIGVVRKVAPIVSKVAPIAGKLVSKIPHPVAKAVGAGISTAGTLAGKIS